MDFHPSNIPIRQEFTVPNEEQASQTAEKMVMQGFDNAQGGYKVLIPKEKSLARRIGFLIMNELNYGLKKTKQEKDVKYWVYHHDDKHYAMVLISNKILSDLGF